LDTLIATAAGPAGDRTVIPSAAAVRPAVAIFVNRSPERRFRDVHTVTRPLRGGSAILKPSAPG
jgi:hypothetical protein